MILEICSLALSLIAMCLLIRNQIEINRLEAKWSKDYQEMQEMLNEINSDLIHLK